MVQALIRQSACIADLKKRARQRIPQFAFDYVEGGCNSENTLRRNRIALNEVCLRPDYLKSYAEPELSVDLFGHTYNAPFGIAPLGLTGLVWPKTSAMHARAAHKANIPFILSTLSTTSIEEAAAGAKENFWFQMYPPSDLNIREDLIKRAEDSGCKNLVVTLDVPSASRRPKDIKSGLAIPPKITLNSVFQSALRPLWSLAMVKEGLPQFASLQPYLKGLKSMDDVANFVRFALREVVDETMLKQIRDRWKGNLIVKGINHVDDARRAAALGVDGIIVSNHGGRQLDAALPSITSLQDIVAASLSDDLVVMVDSGVESGVDIARFLAHGAHTVFSGRAFLYGVAAHQERGAEHTIDLLHDELQQVMSQLHCGRPSHLQQHLLLSNQNE